MPLTLPGHFKARCEVHICSLTDLASARWLIWREVVMAEAGGAGSDLDRWLEPFPEVLGHKKRRTWAPMYLRGLLGPSERKSLQPMAASLGLSGHDQLQHFIASPTWDDAPLWRVLAERPTGW